jgi:CheY-like chemotaxis protein
VEVAVRRLEGNVEVSVRDNGIGLEREALDNIFQRFWQADRSTTRRYGGLGLGLAIVRHLVELHGGSVTAESEGKGKGATFTVTIPARRPMADGGPGAEEEETFERVGGHGASSLHGLTVLVVDDDEDAREVAAAALRRHGAEVVVAPGAADGIRLVAVRRPHIVVADIGMPGEDGYAFIRQLREQGAERGGETPAVALTAYGRSDDRARALAAGYAEHIVKPVPPDVLAATLSRVLAIAGPYSGRTGL